MEVGPRDVNSDAVFLGRRDKGVKEKQSVPRAEIVANVTQILDEIQDGLFQKARAMRDEHTCEINSSDEFREYFTPRDDDKPEIHGGFAWCHWTESPEVEQLLKDLKVTIRCVPLADNDEAGTCIFTGSQVSGAPFLPKPIDGCRAQISA